MSGYERNEHLARQVDKAARDAHKDVREFLRWASATGKYRTRDRMSMMEDMREKAFRVTPAGSHIYLHRTACMLQECDMLDVSMSVSQEVALTKALLWRF